MNHFSYVKVLLLSMGLLFCCQAGFSQVATMAAKMEHQNTLPDHYDQWKRSATRGAETSPNLLVTSTTLNDFTTHVVQLGFNLTDQSAATSYADKIAAQPGIMSASADHATNRITIQVKAEDEHDALQTYLDVQ